MADVTYPSTILPRRRSLGPNCCRPTVRPRTIRKPGSVLKSREDDRAAEDGLAFHTVPTMAYAANSCGVTWAAEAGPPGPESPAGKSPALLPPLPPRRFDLVQLPKNGVRVV